MSFLHGMRLLKECSVRKTTYRYCVKNVIRRKHLTKEEYAEKLIKLFKSSSNTDELIFNSSDIIAAFLEVPEEMRKEVYSIVRENV